MNDFDEMDESDLLFGNNDCIDEHVEDDDDDDHDTTSGSESLDDDSTTHPSMAPGLAIPSVIRHAPAAPSLLRSRSMPSNAKFLTSKDEQKWRVKYLSALTIKSMTLEPSTEESNNHEKVATQEGSCSIPRPEKRSPSAAASRPIRTRKMSSGPIEIPQRSSFDEVSPRSGSRSSSGDWSQLDYEQERYQRNLNQYEQAGHEFVPPHQMVQRDCFSLGMKHHFRPKQGKI
ncbi:Aste57867_25361 [Aphanomyces stellatus]|uniref:Aste57867_25361 protein n=1 Tax=Aphanomyces stellatus TaxID=120398 RepID=A0A485LXN2_9STRA|nr:hypothetical protein As57867_025283 [Aphanomyces stellatus]VFU01986.1 Aste57867_25361 [Aphanomyces stellatus]